MKLKEKLAKDFIDSLGPLKPVPSHILMELLYLTYLEGFENALQVARPYVGPLSIACIEDIGEEEV